MSKARDKDFNDVYVDLSLTTEPNYTLDDDGYVICDTWAYSESSTSVLIPITPAGNEDNPLSFEQFRKYVSGRLNKNISGTDRTFHIRGAVDATIDYGLGDMKTGIFNMRYSVTGAGGYNVYFTNWIVDEPYKMKLSARTSATIFDPADSFDPSLYFINSTDVKITINNMDLQGGTIQDGVATEPVGNIICINDGSYVNSNPTNNKITLYNCRWLTTGNGVYQYNGTPYIEGDSAFVFSHYSDVYTYDCIFHSNVPNNNFTIHDYHTTDSSTFDDNTFDYYLVNSVFLNLTKVFRSNAGTSIASTNPDVKIDQCVFSGPTSAYSQSILVPNQWQNLLSYASSTSSNQFDFPIPSISWDISTLTNNDYNYLTSGWENITLSGDSSDSVNLHSYGERDGLGALYFTPMPQPSVSASKSLVNIGDTVILQNGVSGYSNYSPSIYSWDINGALLGTSTDPQGIIPYSVSALGSIDVAMEVSSHNKWYNLNAVGNLRSVNNTSTINMGIKIYNNDNVETTTFEVYEGINVDVTNLINSSTQIVKSVSVVYADTTTILNSAVTKYNGTELAIINDDLIGTQYIHVIVNTVDNKNVYYTFPIEITDIVRNPYYVDLSLDYENGKWLDLDYGVYDNFEDGSISTGFNSDFRTKYTVISMRNDMVANGTQKSTVILDGIQYGKFIYEWSFVRNKADEIPDMYVQIDSVEYRFDWDYIGDCINIYYGDTKRIINYGSFVKDLACSNSLDTIQIRVEYAPNTTASGGNFKLSYITVGDDGSWIDSGFSQFIEIFNNIKINVEGTTNTGIGYIGVQAQNVEEGTFTGFGNGSEIYPFSYTEFHNRVKADADPDKGTVGDNGDTYMCRNWRKITNDTFIINRAKNFHINVWNPNLYGPWMLVFDRMTRNVDFSGSMLSNGIIYNTEDRQYDLLVTTLYDMFVTWNGDGKIGFVRYPSRYSSDSRTDIIGSTIKSNGGFYTEYGISDV